MWNRGSPPGRSHASAPRSIGTALAVGLLTALFVILTWNVLDGSGLARMDPAVATWVGEHRTDPMNLLARGVTVLGDTLTRMLVVLAACAMLLRWGHRREAGLVAVAGVGGAALTAIVKRLVDRARPPAADAIAHEASLSYPSGHSLGSLAVFGILAITAIPLVHRRATRVLVAAAAALCVIAVGATRVYLGVHWTTDVLAGWTLGGLWLLLCVGVYRWISRRDDASPATGPRPGTSIRIGARDDTAPTPTTAPGVSGQHHPPVRKPLVR